jgi:hypothetical protein
MYRIKVGNGLRRKWLRWWSAIYLAASRYLHLAFRKCLGDSSRVSSGGGGVEGDCQCFSLLQWEKENGSVITRGGGLRGGWRCLGRGDSTSSVSWVKWQGFFWLRGGLSGFQSAGKGHCWDGGLRGGWWCFGRGDSTSSVGWNGRVSFFYVAGSFQCFFRELRTQRVSYTASIDSKERTRCIKVE